LLDIQNFKQLVIVSTLKDVDLYSESAANLLLGTAIQESRLTYLKQKGGGPALGLFQIEPATLNDIYYRYLKRDDKKELLGRVQQFTTTNNILDQLVSNIPFAVLIARIRYLMSPEPLPAYDDLDSLAAYWKAHYNCGGKGHAHEFVENYKRYALGVQLAGVV